MTMMFGSSSVAQKNSGPTETMTSWEAPATAPAKGGTAEFLKGSLTIPAMFGFLRENGRRILMIAAGIFVAGTIVLLLVPTRFAATALVVVDPREQRVTADQDVLP